MTSPLHFLATVACDAVPPSPYASPYDSDSDKPSNPWRSPLATTDALNLQHYCSSSVSDPDSPPQPLRQSNAPNHHRSAKLQCATSPSRRKTGKKHCPDAMSQLKHKQLMRQRRQLFMERAMRIKSLDNSPVNDHQLHVLRMVYDQITMYPPESWMVLIAIVIRRAFKQVKNWFSNERQKNKEGKSIRSETLEGDKVRLRPLALQQACPQWSDAFFEEVIMIYDYKVLMQLRANDPA